MNSYPFTLEKYNGIKSRYTCPRCLKKHQLTRYVYIDTLEQVHPDVGKCNRKLKCDYNYTPKQFFNDNKFGVTIRTDVKPPKLVKKETSYIAIEKFQRSLSGYENNNFVIYLNAIFGNRITEELIIKYNIGTSKRWGGGATVFWLIDLEGKIRTGKIIKFDPKLGKRIKKLTSLNYTTA